MAARNVERYDRVSRKHIYDLQSDRSNLDRFTVKSDRSIESHPDDRTARTFLSLFFLPFFFIIFHL